MTTAILRASAWDQAAQAKAIPPRLHNLIADNEKILTKILNTSRMELEAVAKTYKNPAELEQILRALINRGFITTDTHSEDITRFKSNVGSAFEIGLFQGPTPANPAVMSIIQETMVNSAVNYITKLDSDLKMQLGQIMADGYKNKVFPTDIVKQMSERVGITQGRAGMIARTETMRSSNIANWSQAKANGQKYFIVDHRGAACIYCKQIASKGVFSIDETRYVPPYHPNCACVPIFFDDKADAKDYLDRVMKRNKLEIKEMKRQGYKIPKDGTGINLTGDEQTKIIKKVAKKPTKEDED